MNDTPNYPYLAGLLRSTLEHLAFDEKFSKIDDVRERMAYLQKLGNEANMKAIEYENEIKEILARAA